MSEPRASRPHMPGYGILDADQGRGLLAWSWAEERLRGSHDYWVASVWPEGRPHVMPVWGVWWDQAIWFSSGGRSRKARNLSANPRCVVTTEDPRQPVVLEGSAERISDPAVIGGFLDALNHKYSTDYGPDFLDPAVNATFRVRPAWVFGLSEEDFTGSPTRWVFTP